MFAERDEYAHSEIAYLFLAGIFLVSLVVANLITAKLFVFFGVVLAAGIIPYPVTFLATDLICEVYGRKRATTLVFIGFVLSFYVLLVIKLGQHAEPYQALNRQTEYEVIFGNSARAIIASMAAYLVAQYTDVRLFHFWKRLTSGRHLWLRNNGSTVISQMIDTILVVTILFYGQLPNEDLLKLICVSYLFKFGIALLDTPFFYFGSRYLQRYVDRQHFMRTVGFWHDLGLACAALANIALLVGAGLLWHNSGGTYWGLPAVGIALLLLGVAQHVLITVGLARADNDMLFGSLVGVFGAVVLAAATAADLSGTAAVVIISAGFVTLLCGTLSILAVRQIRTV